MTAFKFRLYDNIWWVFFVLAGIACLCVFTLARPLGYGLAGVLLAALFWIQRQCAEDLNRYARLFTGFNARYAGLGGPIAAICDRPAGEPLDSREKDCLNDYFALCGEVYCSFTQGLVHPDAWAAWRARMRIHYYNDRIRKHWNHALKDGQSLFGLDAQILK